MNSDTLSGNAKDLGGTAKSAIGDATGEESLRAEGMADQVAGKAKAIFGDAKDAAAPAVEKVMDAAGPAVEKVRQATAPAVDKVRSVSRDKPWAAALAAGVIGIALLNTLRGRNKA